MSGVRLSVLCTYGQMGGGEGGGGGCTKEPTTCRALLAHIHPLLACRAHIYTWLGFKPRLKCAWLVLRASGTRSPNHLGPRERTHARTHARTRKGACFERSQIRRLWPTGRRFTRSSCGAGSHAATTGNAYLTGSASHDAFGARNAAAPCVGCVDCPLPTARAQLLAASTRAADAGVSPPSSPPPTDVHAVCYWQ